MPVRQSRRQRQQKSDCEDMLELELLEEVLEARCCRGAGAGRLAAAVCSCKRREASEGLAMCRGGAGRKARSGLDGSANVYGEYSEVGRLGVSTEKWAVEEGRILK